MKTTRIQISWQRRTRIIIVVLSVKITLVPSKLDTRLLKHNPPPPPPIKIVNESLLWMHLDTVYIAEN